MRVRKETAGVLAAMYNHYIAALSEIGTREFQVTLDEARNLAQEVLIGWIGSRHRGGNTREWLTGAMRAAAQHRMDNAKV